MHNHPDPTSRQQRRDWCRTAPPPWSATRPIRRPNRPHRTTRHPASRTSGSRCPIRRKTGSVHHAARTDQNSARLPVQRSGKPDGIDRRMLEQGRAHLARSALHQRKHTRGHCAFRNRPQYRLDRDLGRAGMGLVPLHHHEAPRRQGRWAAAPSSDRGAAAAQGQARPHHGAGPGNPPSGYARRKPPLQIKGQTVAIGVTGLPTAPGSRKGGAVSKNRLRPCSRSHVASGVRCHSSPR